MHRRGIQGFFLRSAAAKAPVAGESCWRFAEKTLHKSVAVFHCGTRGRCAAPLRTFSITIIFRNKPQSNARMYEMYKIEAQKLSTRRKRKYPKKWQQHSPALFVQATQPAALVVMGKK